MRLLALLLTACLALAACERDPNAETRETRAAKAKQAAAQAAEGVPATLTRNLPLAACLAEQAAAAATDPHQCPTYILLALDPMQQMCVASGGSLQPAEEAEAWTLDVNGDGQSEMLVDLSENYICYGAPSALSCGSLGCPFFLYTRRGDAWVELGALNADDAPKVEVLAGKTGEYATLRGGCLGERPCSELTHYEWQDVSYSRTWIDYRGHIVDVVPGGLMLLNKDSAVRTGPASNAPAIDEYPAGTAVVVLGNSRTGPWQLVSPCNACRRGFVEIAALSKAG